MDAHTICIRFFSASARGTVPTYISCMLASMRFSDRSQCSSPIVMELHLSLLRAVVVALLALQCGVFSVAHGHPAAGGTAAGRYHEPDEDDYSDDDGYGDEYYYYEEDDVAADTVYCNACAYSLHTATWTCICQL